MTWECWPVREVKEPQTSRISSGSFSLVSVLSSSVPPSNIAASASSARLKGLVE